MRVTSNLDCINSFTICNAVNVQAFPDVAFGGSTYLVAWSDSRLSSSQYNIYAARISTSGTVLDSNGLLVGTPAVTTQLCPSTAYGDTRFIVVWGNYSVPGNVYGRFVYADGTMNDTFKIASANYVYGTDVAYSGTNYLVIWAEDMGGGYSLRGQLVSTSGSLIGSMFTIATNVEYYLSVHVCYDGTNYFVVYADAAASGTHQIYGIKYNTSGVPVGSAILVSNSIYLCYYPNVAAGSNNVYLNMWDEERGMYSAIYGNVDIQIVGIEEKGGRIMNIRGEPTIVRGPIVLPNNRSCKIYDVSGKEIKADRLAPGVYFIKEEGLTIRKIIKVR